MTMRIGFFFPGSMRTASIAAAETEWMLTEPPSNGSHDDFGKIEQTIGQSACIHHFGGEDEKRHGQQNKLIFIGNHHGVHNG